MTPTASTVKACPPRPLATSQAQVDRILDALTALVRLSGLSRREIERRLLRAGCGVDLNRLLKHRFEPRLHQLLDILMVLEVQPMHFLHLALGEPTQPSPLIDRAQALFGPSGAEGDHRGPVTPTGHSQARRATDIDSLARQMDDLSLLLRRLLARVGSQP